MITSVGGRGPALAPRLVGRPVGVATQGSCSAPASGETRCTPPPRRPSSLGPAPLRSTASASSLAPPVTPCGRTIQKDAEETRTEKEKENQTARVVWAAVVQAEGGGVDVEVRPRRWTDGARDPERTVIVAVTYAGFSREVVRSRIDGVARRKGRPTRVRRDGRDPSADADDRRALRGEVRPRRRGGGTRRRPSSEARSRRRDPCRPVVSPGRSVTDSRVATAEEVARVADGEDRGRGTRLVTGPASRRSRSHQLPRVEDRRGASGERRAHHRRRDGAGWVRAASSRTRRRRRGRSGR
jgi:hypothetical protein